MAATEVPKLTLPLEYQQEIFREIQENDQLTILARGLGQLRIVTNFLHALDVAGGNLVLVINASDDEITWMEETLMEAINLSRSTKAKGLTTIKTDAGSPATRKKLYERGGIFTVTTRILITDLLTDNMLDISKITGIVVLHAEKTTATSQEAFALRIYRENNQNGFIKAFSERPEDFAAGYSQLTKVMRELFIRRSSIWPRFHLTVRRSLESKKGELIELEVAMTETMKQIQLCLVQCIEICVREIRSANRDILDVEEWKVENALETKFDEVLRRKLSPVWHQVGRRSKQLVEDLTALRGLLQKLLNYDCCAFLRCLDMEISLKANFNLRDSPWLLLDEAQPIFELGKRRVYSGEITLAELRSTNAPIPKGIIPNLEEPPKWRVLAEILEEIDREQYLNPQPKGTSNNAILIMCSSDETCEQLRQYLKDLDDRSNKGEDLTADEANKNSARKLLLRKLKTYFYWKKHFSVIQQENAKKTYGPINGPVTERPAAARHGRQPPNKRRRVRGASNAASNTARSEQVVSAAPVSPMTSMAHPNTEGDEAMAEALQKSLYVDLTDEIEPLVENFDLIQDFYELCDMDDLIIVHKYNNEQDEQLLEEVKPRYVIMYEPKVDFVRRIEVYRSSHPERKVKVYTLYYENSVEEKSYLSNLRFEKDAFSKLIREKGQMALTLDAKASKEPSEDLLRIINTRIAGGGRLAATSAQPLVVVDIREFRSHLPALLHGKLKIVPNLLNVGDYVLTPDICVERKSIADLIGSFNDGRLYTQCENMTLCYKRPMLLIEMGEGANPSLDIVQNQPNSRDNDLPQDSVQGKLALLALTFKSLQIIWSTSPAHTAEIFMMLKSGQPEPDPVTAARLGTDNDIAGGGKRLYNYTPVEMLRKVPGVDAGDVFTVASQFQNLSMVANATERELAEVVGKERAGKIHRFFTRKF